MAIDEKKLIEDVERLQQLADEYIARFNGECDYKERLKIESELYKEIINLINAQPKLDVSDICVGKWIPCSKELPKKSGMYYVSGKWKDKPEEVWLCEFLYLDFMGSGGWCNSASRPIVQAWMEKPEPYKGDE